MLKNWEIKNDPTLYDYRRKIKSELQYQVLRNIHYPILTFGVVYGLVRTVKSGYWQAVIWAAGATGYVISSFYNTSARFAFEVAYPAHPSVIERRELAIQKWFKYQPEIIKFELEYLNKFVFKDGYKREFTTPEGLKYSIAVEDGNTYINCTDNFEDIFGFRKSVLEENKLMDILTPDSDEKHKHIGKFPMP